jgi:hypothetical protein
VGCPTVFSCAVMVSNMLGSFVRNGKRRRDQRLISLLFVPILGSVVLLYLRLRSPLTILSINVIFSRNLYGFSVPV